jgi:hypothetical protein
VEPQPSDRSSWSLDYVSHGAVAADGGGGVGGAEAGDWIAGFVRLELRPDSGVAWYWAYVVGPEVGLVTVRDHEVPLPSADQLVVRADGLWAELVRETVGEHWSVGLEAFGVRLDDPADGFRDEIGERLAVGLDLEWEISPDLLGDLLGDLVGQPVDQVSSDAPVRGTVFGEVLIGRDRIELDGTGVFDEAHGEREWTTTEGVAAELGPDGMPTSVTVRVAAEVAPVEILARAALPIDGSPALGLVRVLGRWTGDDGSTKVGWLDLVERR